MLECDIKGVGMIYNKLVRDKIPDIIAADRKKCDIEILSEHDYLRLVNTDELVHTARSSSACFPVFQCTLSAA